LRNELQAQMATSRAQEQRIEALESELRAARGGSAPALAVTAGTTPAERPAEAASKTDIAPGDPQLDQKVEAIAAEVADMKKSFGERLKISGRFHSAGTFDCAMSPSLADPRINRRCATASDSGSG
jgi:hypothetical protein